MGNCTYIVRLSYVWHTKIFECINAWVEHWRSQLNMTIATHWQNCSSVMCVLYIFTILTVSFGASLVMDSAGFAPAPSPNAECWTRTQLFIALDHTHSKLPLKSILQFFILCVHCGCRWWIWYEWVFLYAKQWHFTALNIKKIHLFTFALDAHTRTNVNIRISFYIHSNGTPNMHTELSFIHTKIL